MADFEVILTGTGYPRPAADRAGPGTLVRAGGLNLQFDCGRGTTMRLAALDMLPAQLDALLFTHYHSDHMTDLIDLIMTRWIIDPSTTPEPLHIYGPESFRESLEHLQKAMAPDIKRRQDHSGKSTGAGIEFHEFKRPQGGELVEILNRDGVRVLSAAVEHGNVLHAVGYRVEYQNKVIAISGDTTYAEGVIALADNADVLVHEVIDDDIIMEHNGGKATYIVEYHSTPNQVADMATKAGVKKLLLTHIIPTISGEQAEAKLRDKVAKGYSGPILVGRDLTRVSV